LGLPITAIIIEIRDEVNVHYQLHGHDAELDYSLVIECTVIGFSAPLIVTPEGGMSVCHHVLPGDYNNDDTAE